MKRLESFGGLIVGFTMGISLLVSCGGQATQKAVADVIATVSNAVDIVYNNTTSGLASTTVQDALDELAAGEYTDAAAVTAMGTKANSNALNHDRYTDAEAVTAMGTKANSNALNHDRYTDAEAVTAIKAADGAGSTLDADLLDGSSSAAFATIGANTFTGAQTATGFTISSAKTGYFTVVGAAFIPDSNGITFTTSNSKRRGQATATVTFHAPVYLPNAATITQLSSWVDNNDSLGSVTINLKRFPLATDSGGNDTEIIATTTTNGGFAQTDTTMASGTATVDNSTYAYFLTLSTTNDSGSVADIEIQGARVDYTYTAL